MTDDELEVLGKLLRSTGYYQPRGYIFSDYYRAVRAQDESWLRNKSLDNIERWEDVATARCFLGDGGS